MIKVQATETNNGPLELSITQVPAPTIDDLWVEFSESHAKIATSMANTSLRIADKIVMVESDAGIGRTVTVWFRNLDGDAMDDINHAVDSEDITVWVDDQEFDPWADYSEYLN